MNAPSFATPPPPEAAASDLDARILRVEQRLIAREQKLCRDIDGIGLRTRQTLQPWRRRLPVIGLALAVSALGALLWRRRRRGPADAAARRSADTDTAGPGGGGIPWVSLVALGWPLLPAAWRARISPATASAALALVLPLVERLLQGRRPPPQTLP